MGKAKRNRNKHNIQKQLNNQEQVVIAYYRSHPAEFIESHLNVKLTRCQKFMLNRMKFKEDDSNGK